MTDTEGAAAVTSRNLSLWCGGRLHARAGDRLRCRDGGWTQRSQRVGLQRGQEPSRASVRLGTRKQGSEALWGGASSRGAAPPRGQNPLPTSRLAGKQQQGLWAEGRACSLRPQHRKVCRATWPGAPHRQDGGRGRAPVWQAGLRAFGPSDHGRLHGEPEAQVGPGPRPLLPGIQWAGGRLHTRPPTTVWVTTEGRDGAGRMVPSGPGWLVSAGMDSQTPAHHATGASWPLLPGTRTRQMPHPTRGALLSPGGPEGHGKAETTPGGLVGLHGAAGRVTWGLISHGGGWKAGRSWGSG